MNSDSIRSMKIIIVSKHPGQSRSFTLGGWTRALLSVCLLGLPTALGVLGYSLFADGDERISAESLQAWETELATQKQLVEKTRQDAKSQLAALTLKIGELQGRLMRLDALGERLTQVAQLDQGEFNFSNTPAIGGPESTLAETLGVAEDSALEDTHSHSDFLTIVEQLAYQIDDRQQQLEILEALLNKREIEEATIIAGRPVAKGWISSRFGRRTDPFSGKVAFHSGVDFSAKEGTEIMAVAAGVVTRAGKFHDYGYMVEVNHAGNYATRCAH